MKSLVRHESARIVHVGFLSGWETNGPPSATNRFRTSWAWQLLLSTEVFGSSPMRVPCHRVIGGSGALTGYAGGIRRKTWLLQHEGALEPALL